MNKEMNKILIVGFAWIFSTLFFCVSVAYIISTRNLYPMNILQFAALEYCGLYLYTIYDKINKL